MGNSKSSNNTSPNRPPSNEQKSSPKRVSLELQRYSFHNPRRGRCIIINNYRFKVKVEGQRLSNRYGTEMDALATESLFRWLGFKVTRYNDLTVAEMSRNISEVAHEDHSDADCFACVLLSHGDKGVIYGTDGSMKLESIINMFKEDECPKLAGKPKLFFIQACRGVDYDRGIVLPDAKSGYVDREDSVSLRRIPIEPDILIAYAVAPGYVSYRNPVDGSWFVQALVLVFHEYAEKMDVLQMMTMVNRIVAYTCETKDGNEQAKQAPCFVSTLTRQVFLKPVNSRDGSMSVSRHSFSFMDVMDGDTPFDHLYNEFTMIRHRPFFILPLIAGFPYTLSFILGRFIWKSIRSTRAKQNMGDTAIATHTPN